MNLMKTMFLNFRDPRELPDGEIIFIDLGRRRRDAKITFDPHASRACVRNVRPDFMGGRVFLLEPLQSDVAVALVARHWGNRVFILNARTGWDDDQYFKLAELKITTPGVIRAPVHDPENGNQNGDTGDLRRP